jgi:hypothetical protein
VEHGGHEKRGEIALFGRTDFDAMEVKATPGHKALRMPARYTHKRAVGLAPRMDGVRRGDAPAWIPRPSSRAFLLGLGLKTDIFRRDDTVQEADAADFPILSSDVNVQRC